MSDDFHKPVMRSSDVFDRSFGAEDPAEVSRVAHSTAQALVSRVRAEPGADVVERLIAFTDEHGIDDIAELWSRSPARTLPGTLWRLYLLQVMIHNDPAGTAVVYTRGVDTLPTADVVIAGAPTPAGPEELVGLIDTILRGIFEGDLAIALDRAAAFCRVAASGATSLADDYDASEPARASELTTRALRLSSMGAELTAGGRLWRAGSLL